MTIFEGSHILAPEHEDIRELLLVCKAANVDAISSATEIAVVCAFAGLVLLLTERILLSNSGWIGRMFHLWLTAKLRELRNAAQGFEKPDTTAGLSVPTARVFYSLFFGFLIFVLMVPWVHVFIVQLDQPKVIFDELGPLATCTSSRAIRFFASVLKIASICAVTLAALRFIAVLVSPRGGRLGLMFKLWFEAKERRLRERAGESS